MIRVCEIQHRITQQHHQLLVLSPEESGQRLLTSLSHDAFSHPLPKLSLRRPKLLPIAANHERCFLFAFLLLVRSNGCAQRDTPLPLRGASLIRSRGPTGHTHTPWGSLSCEAALSCQTSRQIPTNP